ncbi:MAG: hypothetical protein WBX22_08495 [Silvibacterium sp.]
MAGKRTVVVTGAGGSVTTITASLADNPIAGVPVVETADEVAIGGGTPRDC